MARSLPLGFQPNILIIMNDDGMDRMYSYMPLFLANWASSFLDYTANASGHSELCAPARATILSGQFVEHHKVHDNDEGAVFDRQNTILVAAKNIGYHVGAVGKALNGWGETGKGGWGVPEGWPGVDFQRFMYGKLPVYDYEICDENGDLTTFGDAEADYAQDVEKDHMLEFLANKPAGKPWLCYWAPRVPHGGNQGMEVAPRHQSSPVTLVDSAAWGVDPAEKGWAQFFIDAALDPWNQDTIDALNEKRTRNAQSMLTQDEALQAVFADLSSRGELERTVIFFCTDNGTADGIGRQDDKGTPHRAACQIMLKVRIPGQAGGVRNAAVSLYDIAPTICELIGARMPVMPDGMSFVRTFASDSNTFRKASYISMPLKPPTHQALWGKDGRLFYRGIGWLAGQSGSWTDADMVQDQGDQPDLRTDLDEITNFGIYPGGL